jgi:hypothetical protein
MYRLYKNCLAHFQQKKINFLPTLKAGVEKKIRMCVKIWCNDDRYKINDHTFVCMKVDPVFKKLA